MLSKSGWSKNWIPSKTEWWRALPKDVGPDRWKEKDKKPTPGCPCTKCTNRQSKAIIGGSTKKSKKRRADKRNYTEQKVIQAEDTAKRRDSRTLYKLTNEIIDKKPIQDGPIKNSDGVLITELSAIDETWANHFEKVLSRPPPDKLLDNLYSFPQARHQYKTLD